MTSYIPLLAVQQRDHRIGYDMPVHEYASEAEIRASVEAVRSRLRQPALSAPKPISRQFRVEFPSGKRPAPRDVIDVAAPPPVDVPMTNAQRIMREVCMKHRVTKAELVGPQRSVGLVAARHEAMYRMKKETTMSLPAIGRKLGDRDHTTILHGVRKYEAKLRAAIYERPRYGMAKQVTAQ